MYSQNGFVHLHTRVAVQASSLQNETFTEEQNEQLLITTVGKLIFNEILPNSFPYINEPTKSKLEKEKPEKNFIGKGTKELEEIQSRDHIDPLKKGKIGRASE